MTEKIKKPKRPYNERKAIRALMVTMDCNYTTALREYYRLEQEANQDESSDSQK